MSKDAFWARQNGIYWWYGFSFDAINGIAEWRGNPAGYFAQPLEVEAIAQREDPDWPPDWPGWGLVLFQSATERLVVEVATHFENLDPAPLLDLCEAFSAWYEDGDAQRVPPTAELRALHRRAIPIVRAVDFVPGMRRAKALGSSESEGPVKDQDTAVISSNDDRDLWIYLQAVEGVAFGEIVRGICKRQDWSHVDEDGARKAALRYAKRKGLPHPPKRKQDRTSDRTQSE